MAEPINVPPKPLWWDELAALIAADPDWFSKYAAAEAARGNPYPLIGRVHGYPISGAEIAAICQALETTVGRQTLRDLREVEKKLIAATIDHMVDEDGLTQKQAIAVECKERGRSERHIKTAIAAYGKRRNVSDA